MEKGMAVFLEDFKKASEILDITDTVQRDKALKEAAVKQGKNDVDAVLADLNIASVDALLRMAKDALSPEDLERLKNKIKEYDNSAFRQWILPIITLSSEAVVAGTGK
jgi:spermidine/putrescine-binding protein